MTAVRPYGRSWLDLLFDALTGLPGPTWLAYVGVTIATVALSSSALWLSGLRPWGEPDPTQTFWGIATASLLAGAHHLRNVARAAFDDFQPALGTAAVDAERERFELTTIPARLALVVTVIAVAITPLYYLSDPEAAQVVGLTGIGFVPRIASEGLTSAVILLLLIQSIRQMRRVSRLHEVAEHVDPFRPAPLYAFSRLTAQTGVVLIAFNVAGFAANGPALQSESWIALYLPWLVAFFVGSVAIFLVPLLGMHRRLDRIKDGLAADAGNRLRALMAEENAAIDARDAPRVADLDRSIAAVRHQQEIIARLPTWPWSGGTIRGFGSALFLPLVLFLIQRYLGQLLGG